MIERNDDEYIRPSEEYISDCGIDECNENYDHTADTSYDAYESECVQDEFLPILELDEHILWIGKSDRYAPSRAKRSFLGRTLFPIIWTGFSILWTIAVCIADVKIGVFFGIPLIILGMVMLGNALLGRGKEEKYCITNKKVIIKSGSRNAKYELKDISGSKVNDCGGYGYITLKIGGAVPNSGYMGNTVSYNMRSVTMYGLREPKEVYRIFRNAVFDAKK